MEVKTNNWRLDDTSKLKTNLRRVPGHGSGFPPSDWPKQNSNSNSQNSHLPLFSGTNGGFAKFGPERPGAAQSGPGAAVGGGAQKNFLEN